MYPPPSRKLKQLLTKATELAGIEIEDSSQQISFSFVGRRTIERVNKDFVGHHGITDVICFDYRDDSPELNDGVVIEIIICVDKAALEGAARKDSSFADELALYIVHGLLHAAGYDDITEKQQKGMRRREAEVFAQLREQFDFTTVFGTGDER